MESGVAVHVKWTRAELVAVRESIELTPSFEGRADARNALRKTLRANKREVTLDLALGERLASHLVPVDMQTAMAKVKLLRAVRDVHAERDEAASRRAVDAA